MNSNFTPIASGLVLAAIAAAALAQTPAPAAGGITQVQALPAQRNVVIIPKADIDKSLAARKAATAGISLGVLGAVRAADDRVNVDVLYRNDPNAEGPVVHEVVTEIYYILEGSGELETGGKIDDPVVMLTEGRPTNPASIGPSKRGTKMTGGSVRRVAAGDVVMIPPGQPHRFKSLNGSISYMVVRVNPDYEKGK